MLFTSYTSPADSFATVHELAGVLGIDDSASAFPLSPKVILAFELSDAQADGGADKGTYLELGIRPAVKLAPETDAGDSGQDRPEREQVLRGPDRRQPFGFFDTGLQLSVPVVSGKGGSLEAHGGVDMLWLGDNLKLLNGDDGFKPVGAHRLHVHVLGVARPLREERDSRASRSDPSVSAGRRSTASGVR